MIRQNTSDIIAIFDRDGKATIGFFIEGRWSRILEQGGQVRAWTSPEAARNFLRWSMARYRAEYGQSLDWDVDAVPVLREVS